MRVGVPIPGNEVCREGDQIRTIQAITFQEKKTDISKCEIFDYGEDREEICARDAHSIIESSYYVSSPIIYSVNVCLSMTGPTAIGLMRATGARNKFANPAVNTKASGLQAPSFSIDAQRQTVRSRVIHCNMRFASCVTLRLLMIVGGEDWFLESRSISACQQVFGS